MSEPNFDEIKEQIDELLSQYLQVMAYRKSGDTFKIGLREQYETPFYYNPHVFIIQTEEVKRRPLFQRIRHKMVVGEWTVYNDKDVFIKNILKRLNA